MRDIRNASHQKQNRTQIQKGIPNIADLSEGVPVLRSVDSLGIVEYVRYNGQLYSSAYTVSEPVISKSHIGISYLNDGATGSALFPNAGNDENSVNQFLRLDAPGFITQSVISSVESGTPSGAAGHLLLSSGNNFLTTVEAGYLVKNVTLGTYGFVTEVIDNETLRLNADVIPSSGHQFAIYPSGTLSDLLTLASKVNEIIKALREAKIISHDPLFNDTKGA